MARMALDPRTPVLVGGGQWSNRVDRGDEPVEPVELVVGAARRAADDAGSADPAKLLAAIGSIRLVLMLSHRYRDPGRLVAERLGVSDLRQSVYSQGGGNMPQSIVNQACLDIAAGDVDVVLVGGAEAWRTRTSARRAGADLGWTQQGDDVEAAEHFGGDFEMSHPAELARGIMAPVQVYPLFECAVRALAGAGHVEWAEHLGRLWSGFSEVAATNPHAWIQQSYAPEEVARVDGDNRMICWPYPKRLNSNNAVEQGAAVLVCSVEAAERLGVPRDRWVFPHAGTDGADTTYVSTRRDLHSSPAIGVAGRRALELAGTDADGIAHADVYSCFPSAVQIAAAELGLPLDRPLTVTGGLSFAGGPWNNYVSHSIAAMVARLREHPGDLGLVTANGGYITKHAFGVYGSEPPAAGFRWERPQAEIDAVAPPHRVADVEWSGEVTIEAATVHHDRDGNPERTFAALLTPDGARAWGTSESAELAALVTTSEPVGARAVLADDGTLHLP